MDEAINTNSSAGQKPSACLCVCLCVNQGDTNHYRCTSALDSPPPRKFTSEHFPEQNSPEIPFPEVPGYFTPDNHSGVSSELFPMNHAPLKMWTA